MAPGDPLYRDVEAAYVATFNLHITAMYLAMVKDGGSIGSVPPPKGRHSTMGFARST